MLMKRFFTYLFAMALALVAYSNEYAEPFTFSELLNNGDKSPTINGVYCTLTFDKGTGSTEPQYYSNGDALRVYRNNVITVRALNDAPIERIEFVCTMKSQSFAPSWNEENQAVGTTPDTGTIVSDGDKTFTWTPNGAVPTEVVFTNSPTLAATRIVSMTVTVGDGETYNIMEPTLMEPWTGTPQTHFTIDAGNGGDPYVYVYYTTDGSDPRGSNGYPSQNAIQYVDYFTLSQSATVRARAYQVTTGEWSALVEHHYEITNIVNSVAEYNALPVGAEVVFDFTAVAVYQGGRFLYIRDNNCDIMLVYGDVNITVENGQKIASGFSGIKSNYGGLIELTSPSGFSTGVGYGDPYYVYNITRVSSLSTAVGVQSQFFRLQGYVTNARSNGFTLVDEVDNSEIYVYNRFGIDFPQRDGELVQVQGFAAVNNNALQFFASTIIRDENQIIFSPEPGTYTEGQSICANYNLVAGEPYGITSLTLKFDDGTTQTINPTEGPQSVYTDKSCWAYATLDYYSSSFDRDMSYTDSARYEFYLPVEFTLTPPPTDMYYEPITVQIKATRGSSDFSGVIYYSLNDDTTTVNAYIYDPLQGIPLYGSTMMYVWTFDERGERYIQYYYYDVTYNYIPTIVDIGFEPPAGEYYGRQHVMPQINYQYADNVTWTWKLYYADGTVRENQVVNEESIDVLADARLIFTTSYYDMEHDEMVVRNDTADYVIKNPITFTFDPPAGTYTGEQNVLVTYDIADEAYVDGRSTISVRDFYWTLYCDDGSIYSGNFGNDETVPVFSSGSLQVGVYYYDEVGDITYEDSARYTILVPELTVLPEPGTYYGTLKPIVKVKNLDNYEIRYQIRYDDGTIVGPNYDPWPAGGAAITKDGMFYVNVIWYNAAGQQQFLSASRLHYEILPGVANDVNQDGVSDVTDVVILASLAMGDNVGFYNVDAVDLDHSGVIDVTDVVILAEAVMGQ